MVEHVSVTCLFVLLIIHNTSATCRRVSPLWPSVRPVSCRTGPAGSRPRGFVSPSLDGGLPLFELFSPSRRRVRQPRLQRRILGLKGRDQREQVFQRRRTRQFESSDA